MKTKLTILGSLATLGAAASLNAQSAVTAAVGYHTEGLVPGFNVVGVNVGNAVAAAGALEGAGSDTDVDFTTLLTTGTPYTMQNLNTGETAALTAWDATTLTPAIGSAGDNYEIRQDQTIGDLFGAANEAGLLEGTPETADVIWVPVGDGTYTRLFFNNVDDPGNFFDPKTPGWRAIGANGTLDQSGTVVPFTFGMFVQVRNPSPTPLVFVGHVRGDDADDNNGHGAVSTSIDIVNGFNILNRVVPVGISLAEAGVEAMLTPGTADTGDILWNPLGDTTYDRIYNNNVDDPGNFFDPSTPGLTAVGAAKNVRRDDDVLASGFLLQRRAADGTVAVNVPDRLDL